MNKMIVVSLGMLVLLLGGCVSAYICIDPIQDNEGVIEFKQKINLLAMKIDIESHNLTKEAFNIKLKYFHPCN